ncbi:hypothetical protein SDC9_167914 [bioreactor metagenome]|uniref:Uncharacterized protein n=1 Tax=bioreactor metagenome TaxID=1076179 RepID=A0A645G1L8_9ZZZZ
MERCASQPPEPGEQNRKSEGRRVRQKRRAEAGQDRTDRDQPASRRSVRKIPHDGLEEDVDDSHRGIQRPRLRHRDSEAFDDPRNERRQKGRVQVIEKMRNGQKRKLEAGTPDTDGTNGHESPSRKNDCPYYRTRSADIL